VVIKGNPTGDNVLVRVHDQCYTSEVLGSTRCDCKQQLDASLDLLESEGEGVIIYLQQEGRGIGLANKIAAYSLQDGPAGLDTVDANHKLGFHEELRTYELVPAILKDLGVTSIKLLTNNPFKVSSLKQQGVTVAQRVPLIVAPPSEAGRGYIATKARRMAHYIPESVYLPPAPTLSAAPAAAAASAETFYNPTTGKTHSWALGKATVEAAIAAVAKGELVCVTDDESRENEGDLIMSAALATPEKMAFTVRYTGGVICAALPEQRLDELQLPQMVPKNQDPKNTAFTLTVDCNVGVTTGISATDRATTMRFLADPASTPDQFCRPGHIFPLRAREGGVLARDGHTEATVDLCRLAGLPEAGLLSEIVTADSVGMARMPELVEFCREHGLVLTTIEDLICYRLDLGV